MAYHAMHANGHVKLTSFATLKFRLMHFGSIACIEPRFMDVIWDLKNPVNALQSMEVFLCKSTRMSSKPAYKKQGFHE